MLCYVIRLTKYVGFESGQIRPCNLTLNTPVNREGTAGLAKTIPLSNSTCELSDKYPDDNDMDGSWKAYRRPMVGLSSARLANTPII